MRLQVLYAHTSERVTRKIGTGRTSRLRGASGSGATTAQPQSALLLFRGFSDDGNICRSSVTPKARAVNTHRQGALSVKIICILQSHGSRAALETARSLRIDAGLAE